MKALLKSSPETEKQITIRVETVEEQTLLAEWMPETEGHVFLLKGQNEISLVLQMIRTQDVSIPTPLNVCFNSSDQNAQLISNLSLTPFVLDSRWYASVEGFWQGLKFPDESKRQEIAKLHGMNAKRVGKKTKTRFTFVYEGLNYRTGTYEHWGLMTRAIEAKFNQFEPARVALLCSGTRPLVHQLRRDSKTIPGVLMAEIWMKTRESLQNPGFYR